MAILTNNDYKEIKKHTPDVKTWGITKQEYKDLLQATEDWFTDGFLTTPTSSLKGALDAVWTTTNAQAKHIAKGWVRWKVGQDW